MCESDIQEYFESSTNFDVVSVRLPREDGDTGRMRGFGYIEFAERDGLIAAVSLPDLTLRNRKIRIDISNEQELKRGSGNRGRYDNFGGSSENRDTNWRRNQDNGQDPIRRSSVENGNWRSDRIKTDSPPPARRERYGGGGGDRSGGGGRRNEAPLEERPRLKLQPRTLPLPEFNLQIDERDKAPVDSEKDEEKDEEKEKLPRPAPVPSAAIFGSAKPVDTAAKDREIEERMEKERLEREAKSKEEKQQKEETAAESNEDGKNCSRFLFLSVTHLKTLFIHYTKLYSIFFLAVVAQPDAENDGSEAEHDETKEAPVEKQEIISWRRKADDDGDSAPPSESRKRYSPDRRRRQNGLFKFD